MYHSKNKIKTKLWWSDETRVVVLNNTTTKGMATERGRKCTLTPCHTCHCTRIPFWHVLIEHRCGSKHCKGEGAKQNVSDQMKLELSYIKHNNGRRGHRRGESTLTAIHRCHRTRIPFWYVLIERRCELKHCTKRVQQRKERTTITNNNKRYHSKNKNKITERVRIAIRWNSSCRIQKHNNGRRAMERGEWVHLLNSILVTAPVFHFDTSWLNACAPKNTAREDATKWKTDQPTTNNKKWRFKKKN